MKIHGDTFRTYCPVCCWHKHRFCWKIPFSKVDRFELHNARIDYAPLLQSEMIYQFAECKKCRSIFRNPLPSQQGHTDDYYIKKMKDESAWAGYHIRYSHCSEFWEKQSGTLVDVAAGCGQYLNCAENANRHPPDVAFAKPWTRLIGCDYSQAYVDQMAKYGFEASKVDLSCFREGYSGLTLSEMLNCSDADFAFFSEAFEHMYSAVHVMKEILGLLRPGGRMFFSAQSLEGNLPIRPEETIYLSAQGLSMLPSLLDCRIVDVEHRPGRYWVILEK